MSPKLGQGGNFIFPSPSTSRVMSPGLAPSRDLGDEIPGWLGGSNSGWSNPRGNLANEDRVLKPQPLTAPGDLGAPRLHLVGRLC
jgi:hypothetical protein